jgi:hypothetical protein
VGRAACSPGVSTSLLRIAALAIVAFTNFGSSDGSGAGALTGLLGAGLLSGFAS